MKRLLLLTLVCIVLAGCNENKTRGAPLLASSVNLPWTLLKDSSIKLIWMNAEGTYQLTGIRRKEVINLLETAEYWEIDNNKKRLGLARVLSENPDIDLGIYFYNKGVIGCRNKMYYVGKQHVKEIIKTLKKEQTKVEISA